MARRIAVLTTFEGEMPFAARHPDDGAKLAAGLGPLRPGWAFETWRVSEGQFPADDAAFDAVVVTGSPASVNDERDWIERLKRLLRARHARRQAMVGLCFGHQAIAAALGGCVAKRAGGLRVGTVTTMLHRRSDWMQPAQTSLRLYAAHDEQVVALPPGAELLGGDADCAVGIYTVGRHGLALQYHPEFSRAFMDDLLDELAPDLPPQALARARAQVGEPVDSNLAMRWIAQFIDQACAAR
jgi:GMP synthase-like glutamine amidotransferase